MEITSCANARVKQWVKYHEKKYRDKDQRFLVEGEHLIQEAIAAGLLETLIKTKNCPYEFNFDKEVILASDEVMHKLRMNVSTSTCIGVCRYKDSNIKLGSKVVLLDDVQDPGNAGTIIRTAHSFGFDSVVLSNRSVDLYNEKLIRSTQGALFHMAVVKSSLNDVITKLKKEGVKVYATALQNARGLSEYQNEAKTALIFGNEGKGVSEEVLAMADDRIFIEMSTFESLNVAIAAGICCYAFRKMEK